MRRRPLHVPNLQHPMAPPWPPLPPLAHYNIEPGIDRGRGAPSSPSMRRVTDLVQYPGTGNTND